MTEPWNDPNEDPDAPVDALEALAQRAVDGTLSPTEQEEVALLLARDPAFRAHFEAYEPLFSALDRHSRQAPPGLATEAVRRAWNAAPTGVGWLEVFGGFARGLSVFAALDLLLGALLAALVISRGPVALLASWVLGCKDVLVFVVRAAPTPEAVAMLLPGLLLLTAALLGAVIVGLRALLVDSEARR